MSLIEVLMVAIVVTVSLGIALPSFQDVLANQRMSTARHRITLTFAQARQEAVARERDVVVCPGAPSAGCTGGLGWDRGWLSFEDRDGDGVRSTDEPEIARGEPTTGVKIVATSGRQLVRWRPDGSATGSNVTLTFCDHRGASRATALALNNAGRLRRVATTPQNVAGCTEE